MRINDVELVASMHGVHQCYLGYLAAAAAAAAAFTCLSHLPASRPTQRASSARQLTSVASPATLVRGLIDIVGRFSENSSWHANNGLLTPFALYSDRHTAAALSSRPTLMVLRHVN